MGKLIIKIDPAFFAEKIGADATTPQEIFAGKLASVSKKLRKQAMRVINREQSQPVATPDDEHEISRVYRFNQIKDLTKEQITMSSFKEGLKKANIQNANVLDFVPLCVLQNRANIIATIGVGVREFLQSFDKDNGLQIENPISHNLSSNSLSFIQSDPNTTQIRAKLNLEYLPGFDNFGKKTAGNITFIAEIANDTLEVTFTSLIIALDGVEEFNNQVLQGLKLLGFKPESLILISDDNLQSSALQHASATNRSSASNNSTEQHFHLLPTQVRNLENDLTTSEQSSPVSSTSIQITEPIESNGHIASGESSLQQVVSQSRLLPEVRTKNNNKKLIIAIDPGFYTADIKDSATDNGLRNLADSMNTAYQKIEEQYNGLKYNKNFLANKKETISYEISRGDSYRFAQIEGDVTLENFQNGLVKVGVDKENQKALDFLTLFVLQNQGEILFNSGNAILDFLNKLVKVDGLFKIEIDKIHFKQKNLEIPKLHVTVFTGSILIDFISFNDGIKNNIGEVVITAEINNDTLAVDFKSITLALHDNDKLLSQIETAIKKMGFAPSVKKSSPANSGEKLSIDNNQKIEPDFQLRPLSLQQLNDLKKNPSKNLVDNDPNFVGHGFNVIDKDHPKHEKVGSPQNQQDRQKILIENAKIALNRVMQSITYDNEDVKLLTSEIENALKILELLNRVSKEEINDCLQHLIRVVQNIRDLSISRKKLAEKCTAIFEALNPVVDIFESLESFILRMRNIALDQFSAALGQFDKDIQEIFETKQQAIDFKEKEKVVEDDLPVISPAKSKTTNIIPFMSKNIQQEISQVRDELQMKVDYTFDRIHHMHEKVPGAEFIALSMRLRATITWVEKKEIEFYEKMIELGRKIDNLDHKINSSVTKKQLQLQLACYEKTFDYYDKTLAILRDKLGKLNCHFYTQDYDGKIIHPRNIFVSDNNNADPLNASMDYMSYIKFQAKKTFDGQKQKFSWIDNFLPWKWGQIQIKLQQDTKFHLNEIFKNNNKSPQQKYAQMKQKIADNKPSILNIFRTKERRMYQQLANQAYTLCLLDAFGRGYMTETQLSQKLLQHIKEKVPPNHSQIKDYAELLTAKHKEYASKLSDATFKSLKQSLYNEELSSTAKACLLLMKEYNSSSPQIIADVPASVKKIIQASDRIATATQPAQHEIMINIKPAAQQEADLNRAVSVVRDRIYGFSR